MDTKLVDLDTERSLICACILYAESWPDASEVRDVDFGAIAHQRIWRALRAVVAEANGAAPDVIAVHVATQADGAEGVPLLTITQIVATSPGSSYSAPYYAERILALSRARRLRSALVTATARLDDGGDTVEVSADVHRALTAASGVACGGSEPLATLAPRVLREAIERRDQNKTLGWSTGLPVLDGRIGALAPSDLVVVAGRPGMGKSALASQIALAVARKSGRLVIFFSLEMSREQVVARMIAQRSGVPLSVVRAGRFDGGDDEHRVITATGDLSLLRLTVDDRPALTVVQVAAAVQRAALVAEPALVVVDYLQLMRGDRRRGGNREQEIAEISRGLKALAKKHGCCVLALSQLNRGVEARADKRPLLSDLRESGSIEQDADVVLAIYREAVYSRKPEDDHRAELLVMKHRSGESGRRVHVTWDGPCVRFINADPRNS